MHYTFPLIKNISDVLPAIADAPEFNVAERDGYTVINYHVSGATTFPPVLNDHAAIRRECRGIIFCSETGEIRRRPYHKFFNVNEKDETQENLIDLSQHHFNLEKLDGSMIAPFNVRGRTIWGTKMGDTDVAAPVMKFVQARDNYQRIAEAYLPNRITPIFEWCSRKQRIVLDYAEDQLILTGLREMYTGEYLSYSEMVAVGEELKIPVVKQYSSWSNTDMRHFINHVSTMENVEGFVTRFRSGHMVKLKCDWYCQIHKAKESCMFDRHVVGMILDEKLDDLIPHLLEEDRVKLREFETKFLTILDGHVKRIHALVEPLKNANASRKDFALFAKTLDPLTKSQCFLAFDKNSLSEIRESFIAVIRKNLFSNIDWTTFCAQWFEGIKYNQ